MNTSDPLVTVVTVTYNAGASLASTLESVASQQPGTFEWILVDGGSSDRTLEIAAAGSAGIPARIVSEKDEGLYDAMNKGLGLAKGTYVVFMNAGDAFADANVLGDFSALINGLKAPPSMVYGHTIVEFHDGTVFYRRAKPLSYISHGQPTIHQSVFFRRDAHLEVRYPHHVYSVSADYAVMATLQQAQSDVCLWDRATAIFRNDPRSASNRRVGARIREAWAIQKDILKVPFVLRLASAARRLAAVPYYNFRSGRS